MSVLQQYKNRIVCHMLAFIPSRRPSTCCILRQYISLYLLLHVSRAEFDFKKMNLKKKQNSHFLCSHCQPPQPKPGSIPDVMINLESWMVAGFNKASWLDTGELVDAGPLGPQGRYTAKSYLHLLC